MKSDYTPEEMRGKYICAFASLSGSLPLLDCVRYGGGEKDGKPYLYNSIEAAKNDRFFDPEMDVVMTAEEYYSPDALKKALRVLTE